MVTYSVVQAIALLAAVAQASPLSAFGIASIVESVGIPSHWSLVSAAKPDIVLKMQIGLKQSNTKGLEEKLLDISNPESPRYGKWLSSQEVDNFVKPSEESVSIVKKWLAAHGFSGDAVSQPTSDWIEVNVPVSKAEEMLSTQYSMFHDSISDRTVPRTTRYSVPKMIRDHIDIIQPTTAFLSKLPDTKEAKPKMSSSAVAASASSCSNGVTAECITDFYNVDYVATGNSPLVVTALLGEGARHTDAQKYVQEWLPDASQDRDFSDTYIGNSSKNSDDKATIEGAIDTQIALAIGNPLPISYLGVGPNDGKDPSYQYGDQLLTLGNYLASTSNPPLVVSTSYLGDEPDFSADYMNRICNNFMKATARGISLLFCSGDFGVAGLNHQDSCPKGYHPTFPATCPWVTAVGSTQFTSNGSGETAADFKEDGSSGGGFSNVFKVPDYQAADTKAYTSGLDSSFEGKYDAGGRGFPDVSLVGVNWNLVFKDEYITAYGTSASTPAWAGLIAQLNDYRATNGKSSLGFLNPLLYGNSTVRAALRDITTGNNHGCGEDGFPVGKGWDPVTGLGSVDFAALRKAVS